MAGMGFDTWAERGRLFLSNVRMVLVAHREEGPLKAFDAPLARARAPGGLPTPTALPLRRWPRNVATL